MNLLLLAFACSHPEADEPPARVAESCPVFAPPETVATVADDRLDEISGIIASRRNPHVWWVHNDSGDTARIFASDSGMRSWPLKMT